MPVSVAVASAERDGKDSYNNGGAAAFHSKFMLVDCISGIPQFGRGVGDVLLAIVPDTSCTSVAATPSYDPAPRRTTAALGPLRGPMMTTSPEAPPSVSGPPELPAEDRPPGKEL